MPADTAQTALLFFTRSAASEAAAKSFIPTKSKKLNYKVASLLIHNTRKASLSTNLPVFEITDRQQTGNTFGERLSNAIAEVFEKDFDNVIVVGNDCPQLTSDIIDTAREKLENNSLVLGPDQHGGVYLIGINKNLFQKEKFASRQWQTKELINDIQAAFPNSAYFQLPLLNDINNFAALKNVQLFLPPSSQILALVRSIVASIKKQISYLHSNRISPITFLFGLRAPPLS